MVQQAQVSKDDLEFYKLIGKSFGLIGILKKITQCKHLLGSQDLKYLRGKKIIQCI